MGWNGVAYYKAVSQHLLEKIKDNHSKHEIG
jgi:hypothetical protein